MSLVTKSVIVFAENASVYPVEVIDSSSTAEESAGSSAMSSSSHIPVPIESENSGECKYSVCKHNRFVTCCLFSESMHRGPFFPGIVNFMHRSAAEALIINP